MELIIIDIKMILICMNLQDGETVSRPKDTQQGEIRLLR